MHEITFREWLENMTGKTKLAIFDFDGTLANTPMKPQTKKEMDAMGWNGKDWWGSTASLPDGITFNEEVVEAFLIAKKDPQTCAVLITGRRGITADRVREMLLGQGLVGRRQVAPSNKIALSKVKKHPGEDEHPHLHDEFYCGDFSTESDYPKTTNGKADGSTIAHKKYVIEQKLMNDNIQQIDFWDDRSDHIPHFIKLGMELQRRWPNLKQVTMHRVYPPQVPGATAWVQHIPIRAN
jgi:hypothetical protein